MSTIMPPVPFKSPMTDSQGVVTAVWGDFLKQVLKRIGGRISQTNDELGALFPVTSGSLSTSVANSLVPSGSMLAFAGSVAPAGFLLCDGSAVSRAAYSTLFNAIGTTYGAGDGSTTFNVPNTQGVFLRGAGSQTISGTVYSGTLGASQADQIQGHKHSAATNASVVGAASGVSGGAVVTPAAAGAAVTVGSPTTDGTNGTPRTGSETRPANLGVNWILKT